VSKRKKKNMALPDRPTPTPRPPPTPPTRPGQGGLPPKPIVHNIDPNRLKAEFEKRWGQQIAALLKAHPDAVITPAMHDALLAFINSTIDAQPHPPPFAPDKIP
jgi:hypothetical protein